MKSIEFLAGLGAGFFRQVGYLFLATTEHGLAELEERRSLQRLSNGFGDGGFGKVGGLIALAGSAQPKYVAPEATGLQS